MDFKEIKRIAELMKANELSEFELEDEDFRLAIKRGAAGQPVMMPQPVTGVAVPAPAETVMSLSGPGAAATEPEADDGLVKIESPIVGTFYSAASPDSPAFVKVGDSVGPDTTVCIIEAMKVMNEIKAEKKGVIRKILVENGTPVEYGEALYLIEP